MLPGVGGACIIRVNGQTGCTVFCHVEALDLQSYGAEGNELMGHRISRRHFIQTTAGAAGAAALGGATLLHAQRRGLPSPQSSGIDHIVVVMMENRSFDHMLGWVPELCGEGSP